MKTEEDYLKLKTLNDRWFYFYGMVLGINEDCWKCREDMEPIIAVLYDRFLELPVEELDLLFNSVHKKIKIFEVK